MSAHQTMLNLLHSGEIHSIRTFKGSRTGLIKVTVVSGIGLKKTDTRVHCGDGPSYESACQAALASLRRAQEKRQTLRKAKAEPPDRTDVPITNFPLSFRMKHLRKR